VSATCVYDVEYGTAPGIDMLVPTVMRESLTIRANDSPTDLRPIQMIRGEALYSNVRQYRGKATIKDAVILP
jgi:hypothetical protein